MWNKQEGCCNFLDLGCKLDGRLCIDRRCPKSCESFSPNVQCSEVFCSRIAWDCCQYLETTSTGSISYMSEIYARRRTNFPEIFTISTKKYQILFKIVHFLQKVKYFWKFFLNKIIHFYLIAAYFSYRYIQKKIYRYSTTST